MDLEGGGWIGTITNFNYSLANLGNNAEYESEPNNCKYDTNELSKINKWHKYMSKQAQYDISKF